MNIAVPLIRQEAPDACALACLRMVLAAYGTTVGEAELASRARYEPGGTPIEELERLARAHGLVAAIRTATVGELAAILGEGQLPIVYLNRRVFELRDIRDVRGAIRSALVHAVVPVRITARTVLFNDPLASEPQRRSIGRFAAAQAYLGDHCVVCRKP